MISNCGIYWVFSLINIFDEVIILRYTAADLAVLEFNVFSPGRKGVD